MAQFKKQNAMISDTELSWIGSIGQSFDGLLAPLILFLARPSSTIDNLHWILLTYSIPYGFANSVIFILGTLVCGLYYPHSYLKYLDISPARADLWFSLHGLFDALSRLLIPLLIHLYPINIMYLFLICVFTGFIFLIIIFGLLYTSINALAVLPIILFSFTSVVTASLQYTVSTQLFEKDQIEHSYVYHVIITSLGLIIGPVVGGLVIDITGTYKSIILTSIVFLFISFTIYHLVLP
ncbi:unnamed protein product [Rotaria magnacalcarata]|uniref:Uncharacterized protein n=2 Tax=Rotaria magnacalcarata TaxID=392030 RepID=A0A815NZV3_9BILA|nr:unnamed protein product [Rotaria magnacalcarata]CAF1442442.1 unnamed protein product [Rotaria magnacalcarata]